MGESMIIPTVRLVRGNVELIDQTRLPGEYRVIELDTVAGVCEAIKSLRVRGAPALGVTAAYGLLIAVEERWRGGGHYVDAPIDGDRESDVRIDNFPGDVGVGELRATVRDATHRIGATRPTAVNLSWAIKRMMRVVESDHPDARSALRAMLDEAVKLHVEDIDMCRRIGDNGAALLRDGDAVVTHCNTGGLATGGFGTALGVIFSAAASGKRIRVFADETRPLLQGARLTAWECERVGVPVTVLADGASASLLSRKQPACVIVGADRIAANGDTANKIGTFSLAIAAHRFGVPFYVAAPSSTIDSALADGSGIPIEERSPEEIRSIGGVPVTPASVDVYNPAFDVTPYELVTAIITETAVHTPPYDFAR